MYDLNDETRPRFGEIGYLSELPSYDEAFILNEELDENKCQYSQFQLIKYQIYEI